MCTRIKWKYRFIRSNYERLSSTNACEKCKLGFHTKIQESIFSVERLRRRELFEPPDYALLSFLGRQRQRRRWRIRPRNKTPLAHFPVA